MKATFLIALTGLAFALASCSPTAPAYDWSKKPLPAGTLRKGSLANQKLMMDTALGAMAKLSAKGYEIHPNQSFMPYVVSDPTGKAGSRRWTEKWYFAVKGQEIPLTIDFKESGPGAADWSIRN